MTENNISKEKAVRLQSKSIGYLAMMFYILILIIIIYMKESQIPYSLFSILFVGQGFESLYKYKKNKNKSNLLEIIGCVIAFIGLIILMLTSA
ncbi:DUF6442 family protein [Clostridium estertheticum]|uniref:DUF6442 family protein n=1 Tax=Clostridium estertheticum TaxID=238834 RepID=UPI001C6E9C52|nr:DUF6442 family protein [Clostridium estertheticum]MBW9154044.1 hypothetical protein [Clostridium estertheticum]WLC83482.1 hypothetical protein KTC97_15565 [Clostridium estertheticum]